PRAMPWMASGSAIMLPTVRRGLRLEYGSWKTICMWRRMARISRRSSVVTSRPSNFTLPAGGPIRRGMGRPGGGFAPPPPPPQPQHLAARDREGDAVHGLDVADDPRQEPAPDREVLLEALDLEQRLRPGAYGGTGRAKGGGLSHARLRPRRDRARRRRSRRRA